MKKLMLLSLSLLFTQITLQAMYSTSLHYAALEGDVNKVRKLFTDHADANAQGSSKSLWTPLHNAALYGHSECIEELLKASAHINAVNVEGYTPLHTAALFGNTACVRELLKAGADKDVVNKYGVTPLHDAAKNCYISCVKELLKAGANPFARITNKIHAGKTALKITITKANQDTQKKAKDLKIQASPLQNNCWKKVKEFCTMKRHCDTHYSAHVLPQELYTENFRNLLDLLQDYENRWRGMRVLCIAQHARLGEHSPAHVLPRELYQEIFRHLLLSE